MHHREYRIKLEKPARYWDDGLPLGNGRLGAMVMGKVEEETIFINEETIWYGKDLNRKNPDARGHIAQIRKLLLEGRVQQAQFLARMALTSTPKYCNPYQPAGDLRICMFDHKGKARNYFRELNLKEAIAKVSYELDGCSYEREHFISHKYQVLAVRIRVKGEKKLTLSVNMSRKPFEERTGKLDDTTVYNCGQCGPEGICYFTGVRLTARGGQVRTMGDFAYVEEAESVVIYLAAATDFPGAVKLLGKSEEEYDEREICLRRLQEAQEAGYDAIRKAHVEEYSALFDRMQLTLGEKNPEYIGADAMLEELRQEGKEYEVPLTELMFHYARYLMISSSFDCVMPSNLQGIWNGEYAPPWQCEFTININEEMNYWIAEKCNLPECHMPLFDQLDRMVEKGRQTARELYGCEGFCAHHNTNIWANTDPEGIFEASPFWPMGAAWLCLHLYEHYSYTGDSAFLEERALPVMKEAILFFRDYLYHTKDGEYLTGPSVSPENTYLSAIGQKGALCMAPAMDMQILRELTKDYIEGMKHIGRETDETVAMARDIYAHLPAQKITGDGRLMEWQEEYFETEPGHRHISHLFALHPGSEITQETPEYYEAAGKTLESRLAGGGGHTGWSRAWIICFYARLHDGRKVQENINSMLRKCVKDNLLDTHPPFQIDGNFGLAEGILECLAQSHGGYLEFLPALPEIWDCGSIRGMILRGALCADFDWAERRLTYLALTVAEEQTATLMLGGKKKRVNLQKGKNIIKL